LDVTTRQILAGARMVSDMATPRTRTARPAAPRARQSKPSPLTVTFMGSKYRVADKVGIWPLMQFARAAEAGVSLRDAKGLAALHAMLEDVIHPDDWGQFQDDMIAKKAVDLQAMLDVSGQVVELLTERAKKGRPGANGKTVAGEVEA
jgi:hypothetical protein